jgi:hypothetical protein
MSAPGGRKKPGAFVEPFIAKITRSRRKGFNICPRPTTERGNRPATERAIVATIAIVAGAALALLLAVAAAHGVAELLGAA